MQAQAVAKKIFEHILEGPDYRSTAHSMFSAAFGNGHTTFSLLDDGQHLAIRIMCFFHVDLLRKFYEKILLLTSVIYRGIT